MIGRWDLLGITLVVGFGVSVAALMGRWDERQALVESALAPGADIRPGVEWLGVYSGSQKVGYMRTARSERQGGWRFEVHSLLRVAMMGADHRLDLEVNADVSEGLALERFDFSVSTGPAEFSGAGVVEGQAPDDLQLALTIDTGGNVSTRSVPLTRPPVLQATLGPRLSRRDLSPGETFTVGLFDPLTQQEQLMEIEVVGPEMVEALGEQLEATRIRQRIGGLVLDAWMNDRGELLRQQLAMGLVAVREAEAQARWGVAFGPRDTVDLFEQTLIPVEGMPEDLDTRDELTLSLAGIAFDGLDLHGDRQRFDPSTGVVTISRERGFTGLPLPADAEAFDDHLRPSPLVQSGHPDIIARAEAIAPDAADSVAFSRALVSWIRRHLTRERVIGVPSALEVLQTRRGDCNEHSALFAALARARGVPTRIVAGLMWHEGKFGYHAWNEIAVAGPEGPRWLTVDATWGQLPASVGRLRLISGGLGRQIELLRAIGQLVISHPSTATP